MSKPKPTWETRDDYARRKVDVVSVGLFRLLARPDSYTLSCVAPRTENHPARSRKDARKLAIDAARKQLADWAAELDALEHQESKP